MATDNQEEVSAQQNERLCCFPFLNRADSEIECSSAEVDDIKLELTQGISVLPDEVLTHILLFVPDQDLWNCLTVCRTWCNIIRGQTLWREKCLRNGYFIEDIMAPFFPSDWRTFYFKAPYTRNLIKNCSGQGKQPGPSVFTWSG